MRRFSRGSAARPAPDPGRPSRAGRGPDAAPCGCRRPPPAPRPGSGRGRWRAWRAGWTCRRRSDRAGRGTRPPPWRGRRPPPPPPPRRNGRGRGSRWRGRSRGGPSRLAAEADGVRDGGRGPPVWRNSGEGRDLRQKARLRRRSAAGQGMDASRPSPDPAARPFETARPPFQRGAHQARRGQTRGARRGKARPPPGHCVSAAPPACRPARRAGQASAISSAAPSSSGSIPASIALAASGAITPSVSARACS